MHPIPATPEEVGDGEDRLVDVHSPEVPHSIRTQVLAMAQPGDQLWRCPACRHHAGCWAFWVWASGMW